MVIEQTVNAKEAIQLSRDSPKLFFQIAKFEAERLVLVQQLSHKSFEKGPLGTIYAQGGFFRGRKETG